LNYTEFGQRYSNLGGPGAEAGAWSDWNNKSPGSPSSPAGGGERGFDPLKVWKFPSDDHHWAMDHERFVYRPSLIPFKTYLVASCSPEA